MTFKNFLHECVLEWGLPVSKINKAYKEAIYESDFFNKRNDITYIKETMSIILDIKKESFLNNFMKDKELNLSKFIDNLYDEAFIQEDIMSTDFNSDQRPENAGHKFYTHGMDDVLSDENQEENNKEANI